MHARVPERARCARHLKASGIRGPLVVPGGIPSGPRSLAARRCYTLSNFIFIDLSMRARGFSYGRKSGVSYLVPPFMKMYIWATFYVVFGFES